jgi:hypothetical protein
MQRFACSVSSKVYSPLLSKWCPTHHSTGPAQRAAQAGEFRRYAATASAAFSSAITALASSGVL